MTISSTMKTPTLGDVGGFGADLHSDPDSDWPPSQEDHELLMEFGLIGCAGCGLLTSLNLFYLDSCMYCLVELDMKGAPAENIHRLKQRFLRLDQMEFIRFNNLDPMSASMEDAPEFWSLAKADRSAANDKLLYK